MKGLFYLLAFTCLSFCSLQKEPRKVFDVHIHGDKDVAAQLAALKQSGVYKAAISTSWELQNKYRDQQGPELLFGLMFPCPAGKVPYSLQPCYGDGKDLPPVSWVEAQIKQGKINFLGEVLSQYYGISSSDSLLYPYYALAEKYNLPVGVHTGGAGPDHGSANFKMEMGDPLLLKNMLSRFPGMKVWIMHAGDQYYKETVALMQANKKLFADISVLSNPFIVPAERFHIIMKTFIEAGLEDRLMFGSDNGNIKGVIAAVEALNFLTEKQKNKIFYQNAGVFFSEGESAK